MKNGAASKSLIELENNEPPWKEYYTQGHLYRNTTVRSLKRPEVFKPDIIYNLASMAIEKVLMAVFIMSGNLPFSHTLSAMGNSAKEILSIDESLFNDMARMDRMQMICSEELFVYEEMKEGDIPFFLDVMKRVFDKAEIYINRDRK